MSRPASAASCRPRSVRSTSVHPVNRFSLFHVLSPWRSRTTVGMVSVRFDGGLARIAPLRSERFLDAEQLVVFGDTVGAARGAGLDLPGRRGDGKVGDRRVLGLSRTV